VKDIVMKPTHKKIEKRDNNSGILWGIIITTWGLYGHNNTIRGLH